MDSSPSSGLAIGTVSVAPTLEPEVRATVLFADGPSPLAAALAFAIEEIHCANRVRPSAERSTNSMPAVILEALIHAMRALVSTQASDCES